MKISGKPYRTIWLDDSNQQLVRVIDQRFLPHRFVIADLSCVDQMVVAIRDMQVRGAPLIGAAASFGMYLATLEAAKTTNPAAHILNCAKKLRNARPTAINLGWAIDKQLLAIAKVDSVTEQIKAAQALALATTEAEYARSKAIGEHGLKIITEIANKKAGRVNILTHCNAGWLACIDYGTATSPIYHAAQAGIDLHVWVDETRPRNQGASLTAFELLEEGIAHTVIADNTGGHLMQHSQVDLVIVGADRVTRRGDAANKIGTYLKALSAMDNQIPFYVALPSSTFDFSISDGRKEIPIEERDPDEVRYIEGLCDGEIKRVLLTPERSNAINYGFDVTPARLITALISERGICRANEQAIIELFPEQR